MDSHKEAYRIEAHELIVELEASLMELEENPRDRDLIGRVFRAMHTIKGSGAMFGFDDIAEFTHNVETVFDQVRDGRIEVDRDLVDATLAACDLISKMVDDKPVDSAVRSDLMARFQSMIPGDEPRECAPGPFSDPVAAEPAGSEPAAHEPAVPESTYRIRFVPGQDIFATGTNPLLLLDELRELGPCMVVGRRDRLPTLEEMDPECCYLAWDVVLTTTRGIDAIRDVFIFVEDECELAIDPIVLSDGSDDAADYKKIGEILMERGDLLPKDLEQALSNQKKIGEMLLEAEAVAPDALKSAMGEQQHIRETLEKKNRCAADASVRIATEKLDILVDLVGELVTVQAKLSRKAAAGSDPELVAVAEEVEFLAAELRDQTMSIRMVPIGSTFTRYKRLVRDLSTELGKEISMTTSGAETELDKTLIERLNDPLVHIIRNSIDHGIETPDLRAEKGKPPVGAIHLSAEHTGANVVIRVRDDGAGIDPDAIRQKARERGLIGPEAEIGEKEAFDLIFAPGFSTAKAVTDISGRGVGMDVVRQNIEKLRGSVEVESGKGQGTTICLKLPLTLAIIDGLMVRIGADNYIIPLSDVQECVELGHETLGKAKARNMMHLRDHIVPYLSLRKVFRTEGTAPEIEPVVMVEAKGQRVGLGVDRVVGHHQTVIKSLGRAYRDVRGVSGATILGDGTVALILDIQHLVRWAETGAQTRSLAAA